MPENSYFGDSMKMRSEYDLMEKKIVSLLNTNLRVILPDFGAFIIRQQEPRGVVFNELLRTNDGLLLDYIMKSENVDCDAAQQMLSDYIHHAVHVLDSGSMLAIEGIGSLQKDNNGIITFLPENENLIPEEPEKEQQQETADPLQADKMTVAVSKEQHEVIVEKEDKKQVIIWVSAILVASLLVILFFVLKNPVSGVLKTKKTPSMFDEAVLKQLNDSVLVAVKDSAAVFSDEMPVQGGSATDPDSDHRYYIVAGCFRDEVNADELVVSLRGMGYDAEKFGRIGDLYAVSFASFDDRELAIKELARIRQESNPDAWMTRF